MRKSLKKEVKSKLKLMSIHKNFVYESPSIEH